VIKVLAEILSVHHRLQRFNLIFAGVPREGGVKYNKYYACVQTLNKNVFISYE